VVNQKSLMKNNSRGKKKKANSEVKWITRNQRWQNWNHGRSEHRGGNIKKKLPDTEKDQNSIAKKNEKGGNKFTEMLYRGEGEDRQGDESGGGELTLSKIVARKDRGDLDTHPWR